jgi:hypothetical protein
MESTERFAPFSERRGGDGLMHCTFPSPLPWRERANNLAPEGCLVAPLTTTLPGMSLSTGMMLKSKRVETGYKARFLSQVSIFPWFVGTKARIEPIAP